MKLVSRLMAIAVIGLSTTHAWSADYKVHRTLQLSSSSTEVWNVVGDFCDIDDWHPYMQACALKVIEGRLHRSVTTVDGAEHLEKRIAAEPGLSYTYEIVDAPLPIENFTATFSIESLDGSLISWSARFSADDPKMEAVVTEMLDTGIAAIESKLAR